MPVPTVSRAMCIRLMLAALAAFLLVAVWSAGRAPVHAVGETDPNVYWSIGKADNSNDEFPAGSLPALTFEVGKHTAEKDWRQRQGSADQNAPIYKVRFTLDQAPAGAPLLGLDCFFLGAPPRTMELDVNGKHGSFRVRPVAGKNLDERQANTINFTRAYLRAPIHPSFLKAGANEIGISFLGDDGIVNYDALWLQRSGGEGQEPQAMVEPTIFYRRVGGVLKEVTEVVVEHRQPLAKAALGLKIGAARLTREVAADNYDFGERVLSLDVPALAAPAPYDLTLKAGGASHSFKGEFRPEKRWRIFAGLKIHNDIGYTDLQPHVQELDNRNTDRALELMRQFPFFKFNLETGWLAENYLHSRNAARRQEFFARAAEHRLGLNAMYLNLMTGICTGEEMYRSLYFSKSLQRQHGVPFEFACITDAPSHTWFTPSMLAEVGIKGFANGSNQTRGPLLQNSNLNEDSPFYWEGADGRRVMTWFARSYLQLNRLVGDQPSMDRLSRTIPQFLARYRRANYPVDAVLLYGLYTDNASIRDGEAATIKKWNDTWEFPKLTPATDADYYAYLEQNFAKKLPVFRGDAGAYWEDGAASTALETTVNRASQRMLPQAEMASALATAFHPAEVYPADEFREAWKNLLFYDEHTWGAHNSVAQPDRHFVTAQWEVKRSFAWRAHWAATDLLTRSLNRLVQNISVEGPTLFVFNADLWPRTGMVEVELNPNRQLVDPSSGAPVPMDVVREQQGYRVLRFFADNVPGLGYRAYRIVPTDPKPAPRPHTGTWEIESRYYRVKIDPESGAIASLYDKELGRELADPQAPYKLNQLLYVSGGANSRLMTDKVDLKPPQLEITGQTRASLIENNGHRIRIQAQARSVPLIDTEITVYDQAKRVDIVNHIRKEEVRDKEAVYFAFPFHVSPPELAYQVQNTWIRPNADQLPGACRDWFTTQNVVVTRDAGAAIAWATPDAPLVTLTDINRGRWLTHLDIVNGYIFSYPMHNYWFTNYKASQWGEFTYRYYITSARHLNDPELARFDAETRAPLIGYPLEGGNVRITPVKHIMPEVRGSFFEIDSDHAQLTAFKEAEDGRGYVLRLRETAGQPGVAKLRSPIFPITSAHLANGVEDHRAPLAVKPGGIEIPLKPRGFTTVRLVLGTAR
jgi:alpha-mannosidase